jgi:hypothetical protein
MFDAQDNIKIRSAPATHKKRTPYSPSKPVSLLRHKQLENPLWKLSWPHLFDLFVTKHRGRDNYLNGRGLLTEEPAWRYLSCSHFWEES